MEQKRRRRQSGKDQEIARQRALVILQVRSGTLTATDGAKQLGISRKTYYEWEERSLKAMALALENRPAGRPAVALDEEKETLRERVQELEKKLYLAEKTIEVKEILAAYGEFRDKESKKKPLDRQEAIKRVMAIVEKMKEQTRMPYEVICRTLHLSLGSFNRWRDRIRRDRVLINRPGPKKVEPIDPSALDVEIRLLGHARKRSAGATELYQRHRFSVSRRELGRLVERVRQDLESDRRAHLRRIEWLTPGVVWAIDGTEYDVGLAGKVYLCNTQDLGSRYKFLPLAGGYPVGEEIAGYLSEQFDRFGAPLVLKRDNEGKMNHTAINDVLVESFVLPLNNPEYYAPYNGAIEESQREVKRCLRHKLALALPISGDHISAYAEAVVNDLNHRHRPCLNGKTSCQLFFDSANRPAFSKRERREIYDIIMEKAERILSAMNLSGKAERQSAWRIAVESWLKARNFIKVHINQSVTQFYPNFIS